MNTIQVILHELDTLLHCTVAQQTDMYELAVVDLPGNIFSKQA